MDAQREKVKKAAMAVNTENREKERVRMAKWRAANPEKVKAANARQKDNTAKRRAENPEKERAKRTAWKKANPEKVKASKAKWYQARKEAIRAAYATWKERMPIINSSMIS